MDDFARLSTLPTIAIYTAFAANLLPFLVAALTRSVWAPVTKWLALVGVSFLASAVWVIGKNGFDDWSGRTWVSLGLWILAGAAVFYRLYREAVADVDARTG